MKYYSVDPRKLKLKRDSRRELDRKLTALDRAILTKTKSGGDIMSVIGASKPFINKFGSKEFATTNRVLGAVKKLKDLGLLEYR